MNTAIKEFDVVVIGAGPGGLAAALAAARNGARVLLVEKNGYLGGNMAIGLPLLVAALAAVEIRRRKKLLLGAEEDEEVDETEA